MSDSSDFRLRLYGNSRLLREPPFEPGAMFDPRGSSVFPLGCEPNSDKLLFWSPLFDQGSGLTFGGTRSGKGVCSIIPALLTYSGSMVVVDPKGEAAWVTAQRRRDMGQRVVILDPWDEVNRRYAAKAGVTEEIARFNPLGAIDPASGDFTDDLAAIAEALVLPDVGEAFWNNSAKELITALAAAAIERAPGKATLGDLRDFVTMDSAAMAEAIRALCEANPTRLSNRKLRRFAESGQVVETIRFVAEAQTAMLDSKKLIDSATAGPVPFDLGDLGRHEPVTLYLVIPADRMQTHNRWLRLMLTMAVRAIAKLDTPSALPVVLMLDEMGAIGPLSLIEQAFGVMAGLNIRVWGFLQDLSQLQRDYPRSWETFVTNASLMQVLKVNDDTTSEYVSKLLGTYTVEFSGERTRRSQRGASPKGADGGFGLADQLHPRAILLPQEIRTIPVAKALSIVPGLGNFLLDRVAYFDRDEWIGCYRPLPGRKMKEREAPVEAKKKGWFS